ncbi:hypothetical protein M9Y10_026827 [Tritrichomonas musculus]|uniref:EF-hand domain-containing protein n=1 Tax=Tritrichomonas musculus TaxID=1915356 RepID=A0ABR2H6P4_9EUKA
MYKECFLYSSEIICNKPTAKEIYLHSKDAKVLVSKKIPHFAYFQVPYQFERKWIFYANDIPITMTSNYLMSVPFYKLQSLLVNSRMDENSNVYATNQEISHALSDFLALFSNCNDNISGNTDDDDDIVFFFKVISKNFPFNHFSSTYDKMYHKFIIQKSNLANVESQIEKSFMHFLLAVRPNGKPNSKPLFNFTKSFLIHFPQLIYSSYYQAHHKFVLAGFKYILEYLHNDNEWGPYSVLSFLLFRFEKGQIQSYSLNAYDIDQNPEPFFDRQNLECVEDCTTAFGKLSLVWCYNPCFHNEFIKLAKSIDANNGRKINQKDLINIILCRVCNEEENEFIRVNISDYSSFLKFIQVISPETNRFQLLTEVYNAYTSTNSDKSKLISFQFKIFCENEIKGQLRQPPEKLRWYSVLNEEKKIKLNRNLRDVYSDIEVFNQNSSYSKNDDHFELNKKHQICKCSNNKKNLSNDSEKRNANIHHFNLVDDTINDIDYLDPLDDDEMNIDNFKKRQVMKNIFNQTEIEFIKDHEINETSNWSPFNIKILSKFSFDTEDDQFNTKTDSQEDQNDTKSQEVTTSKEKSFPMK